MAKKATEGGPVSKPRKTPRENLEAAGARVVVALAKLGEVKKLGPEERRILPALEARLGSELEAAIASLSAVPATPQFSLADLEPPTYSD